MSIKYYKVGGAVRDYFIGRNSKDIDYTVEAENFEAMREDILLKGGKIFVEKPEYLTIRAHLNGEAADFVLARKDGTYSDGRRPDYVERGTIIDDLSRRDCTINAIAIDENRDIIDPFGGLNDINHKLIRAVGDPKKRIEEDYLRVFRYLRFSCVLNFNIHRDLDFAIANVDQGKFEKVSIERIQSELDKMFRFDSLRAFGIIFEYENVHEFLKNSKIWFKPTLEEK